jgi:hypothetical protein
MATFTKLIGIQSGLQAIAQSGDTIDFTGFTLTNFSTTAIDDGTGDMTLDGSGNLTTTGIVAAGITPSAALTLTAGADSTWSTSAGALTLTSAAAATWSTAAGALTIDGASGILLAGNSSEIDVTTTGALDLNSGAGTWDASTLSLDSTDTTNLTMTASDAGDKSLTISAANGGAGSGDLILSADNEIDLTSDDVDINATGVVTIDAGGAVSIDAAADSNLTAAGAALTLSTTTSGTLTVDGAALVDVNAGANLDIDVTGTFDMLSSGAMSLDATGASNVSVASGDLTLSTTTSGDVDITSAAAVDITAAAASSITVPAATAAALVIDDGTNSFLTINTQAGAVAFGKSISLEAIDGSTVIVQSGMLAGETIEVAQLVSLDFSTTTRVFKCDADHATATLRNAVGVNVMSVQTTAGNGLVYATAGVVSVLCTDAVAAGGAEIGEFVYASETAGEVTVTAPTTGRVYKVGVLVGDNGNVANAAATVLLQPQFLYDN